MTTAPTPDRRALVVVHDPDLERGRRAPGWVTGLLEERGLAVDLATATTGEALPDPAGYALVVVLGSEVSAYDEAVPWIAVESGFLRAADAAGTPLFGICFGAQLLAQAFGGRVEKAPEPELGLVEIDSDVPGLIPAGPWLESHYDRLVPPPEARVLARTDRAVQAFALGRHVAVQFHPEASGDVVRYWHEKSRSSPHRTSAEGAAWLDPEAVSAALDADAATRRRLMADLLDHVLAGDFHHA